MKIKRLAALLRDFFRPGANTTDFPGNIWIPPGGFVPDAQALYGLVGGMYNANEALDLDLKCVVSSALTLTLTAAQFINSIIDYSGAPGSGVTVTTPTAAQIIAALPSTIPGSGFNFLLYFMNDGAGQTITLAGGAGVTIAGNLTIATNTMRQFLVNVNPNAGTVNMVNMGTQNL